MAPFEIALMRLRLAEACELYMRAVAHDEIAAAAADVALRSPSGPGYHAEADVTALPLQELAADLARRQPSGHLVAVRRPPTARRGLRRPPGGRDRPRARLDADELVWAYELAHLLDGPLLGCGTASAPRQWVADALGRLLVLGVGSRPARRTLPRS